MSAKLKSHNSSRDLMIHLHQMVMSCSTTPLSHFTNMD